MCIVSVASRLCMIYGCLSVWFLFMYYVLTNIKQSWATCLHSLRATVNDKLCTNASYVRFRLKFTFNMFDFWCSVTCTFVDIIDVFSMKNAFNFVNVSRRRLSENLTWIYNSWTYIFDNKFCILYKKWSFAAYCANVVKQLQKQMYTCISIMVIWWHHHADVLPWKIINAPRSTSNELEVRCKPLIFSLWSSTFLVLIRLRVVNVDATHSTQAVF